MKNRDPFSSAFFFASSLAQHPIDTITSTARGIAHGHEMLKPPYSYTTPALGLIGTGLVIGGAASLNPVHIGAGAFVLCDAAGRYLEVGNNIHPSPPAGPS